MRAYRGKYPSRVCVVGSVRAWGLGLALGVAVRTNSGAWYACYATPSTSYNMPQLGECVTAWPGIAAPFTPVRCITTYNWRVAA